MRTLTYTVTTKTGKIHAGITSYNEAKALVDRDGGEMVAAMIDKIDPHNYKGKRVRPVVVAPAEK